MPLLISQKMEILSLLRQAAQDMIMPRFQNLGAKDIHVKTHASDLVTIADKEVENRLTIELEAKFPGARVIGEEAVAADKSLLECIPDEELLFILDPIDGTYNFVNSIPMFGMILSIVERGEVTFGIHYDPVTDYAVFASKGEGAWSLNSSGSAQRISVSQPRREGELTGLIPYHAFRYTRSHADAQQLLQTYLNFDRVTSFRCSAHEYRLVSEGAYDFFMTSGTTPWDDFAGLLIHSEAGGFNGPLDGSEFRAGHSHGILLMAPDKDAWHVLRDHFKFLVDS